MNIGLDLTALTAQHTGVDRYLLNLARALASAETGHRFEAFVNREDGSLFASVASDHFRVRPVATRSRLVRLAFQQVALPGAAAALGLDVVHSPAFLTPLVRGRSRHVVSVHDLTTITMPETHVPLRRSTAFNRALVHSIVNADAVLVPSHHVRNEIVGRVRGVDETRLHVIPYGIDSVFGLRAPEPTAAIRRRFGLSAPYILYVGNIDPRKNLDVLLRAFRTLVSESDVREDLVLAGPRGWDYGEVVRLAQERRLRDRVHLLGYVGEEVLPELIAGARVFAYPSREEGFGFPPLEAMACGVPVVATRTSSLAENLDGAARLVPVGDVTALAEALRAVLRDDDEGNRLRAVGLERARRFSWRRVAMETLAVYESAVRPAERSAGPSASAA